MDERIDLTENRDFRDQSRNIHHILNRTLSIQKDNLDDKFYKKINTYGSSIRIDNDFYDGIDPRFTCDRCGRKGFYEGICDQCHRDLEFECDTVKNLFKKDEVRSIL